MATDRLHEPCEMNFDGEHHSKCKLFSQEKEKY